MNRQKYWFSMREKARIFKSSLSYSRFLIHFFYTQKSGLFCAKASNFNPLKPDLLTLYRLPNPIKIWPTYAVPPTATLYPRSTYDLWGAGSSPTIFNQLKNWSRSPRPLRAGRTNPHCILDQHTLSPIKGPLIADPSIFPKRERAGVDRLSGVNGPLGRMPYSPYCF